MDSSTQLRLPRRWLGLLAAVVLLAMLTALAVGALARHQNNGSIARPVLPAAEADLAPAPGLFRDMTAESGIDFTYRNGEEAGHYAILESLGGGVALIDYDGDGLLDVFLLGGGYFDGPNKDQIKGHANKLYRNLGNWKFKDVTKEAGLDQPVFYTHGATVGDYNNDGWCDLLVTGWGRLALYRNESDGKGGRRFTEVTRQAGLNDTSWSTSAAFGDLDGDGFADLYVCHYVNWSMDNNPKCDGYSAGIKRDVCPPKTFKGLPDTLYRNNGNGTFTDVSKEAGLKIGTDNDGKGLGVVITDLNADGKPDVYVANDTVDNFLYLNRSTPGKIRLEEMGLPAGAARDDRGVPNGSMGVDAGDPYGNGQPTLWVTNYENEMHALYKNHGNGFFLFSTPASGIAAIGQRYVGFGTAFVDVDNKGWEDIVVANGHVIRHPIGAGLKQKPVYLRNLGGGRFIEVGKEGGSYFAAGHVGRGLAVGDLDNDGWPDLIFSNVNEPAALLRNEAKDRVGEVRHWLGIELVGKNKQDLVGARVMVDAEGRRQTRFVKGGGSYCSANDKRLLFGLGKSDPVEQVTVVWPSGQQQSWKGDKLKVDRYWRLVEGKIEP